MLRFISIAGRSMVSLGLALATLVPLNAAWAGHGYTVIHSFHLHHDGTYPFGGVILDSAGNLYGTTSSGGAGRGRRCCGTVYKIAPDGTESLLHSFLGGKDGDDPYGSLHMDGAGNLYGVTEAGGSSACSGYGCGIAFEVTPVGKEKILYAFQGGSDGANPETDLVADSSGNLYGATYGGGASGCFDGCGTVFKIAPSGATSILHVFGAGSDGAGPTGSLVLDGTGNLYGTTSAGGSAGDGTIYEIGPGGAETIIYSFCSQSACKDGRQPEGGLMMDGAGNLYGSTDLGGKYCETDEGCGTVFEFAPNGVETVLHSFSGETDGGYPYGGLIMDSAGNLYGTTQRGGDDKCDQGSGCGVVFKLDSNGGEEVLEKLATGRGRYPLGTLAADQNGYLYGTTELGGDDNKGVAFKIQE